MNQYTIYSALQGRNDYVPVCFNTMKRIFLLHILLLAFIHTATAQTDTTVVKKRSNVSKNIGIGFGFSYSLLSMSSSPFVLLDSTGKLGYSNIKNSLGANISLFYNVRLSERLYLRPGVDAHFLKAGIQYDTRLPNKKNSFVFPVAVEVPITASWSINKKGNFASGPYVALGIRPTIAVEQFVSLYPTIKNTNLNVDAGLGLPVKMKKLAARVELIYSYGLFNLIGKKEDDFYTNSISSLGRNFVGLRFYFSS